MFENATLRSGFRGGIKSAQGSKALPEGDRDCLGPHGYSVRRVWEKMAGAFASHDGTHNNSLAIPAVVRRVLLVLLFAFRGRYIHQLLQAREIGGLFHCGYSFLALLGRVSQLEHIRRIGDRERHGAKS